MLQEKSIMITYQNNLPKVITFLLFLIFLIVGLLTFDDYGLTIDEEFQRASGFYWLNYILEFLPLENLKIAAKEIFLRPRHYTLPPPETYNQWGVIFDLPMALLETIFKINDSKNYYFLRHCFNFILFFVSAIFFFKILLNRFSDYIISIIGTLFYVLSPRIYGNSFYNNKDIVFLSLLVIAVYFCFKLLEKNNFKNLVLFSFFTAVCTASRVIGIFLILSYILFYFLSFKLEEIKLKAFKTPIICLFIYFIFLTILWPYLWSNPLGNFVSAFKFFSKHYLDIKMLYNGEYIRSTELPNMYILNWIFITTPSLYIFLFLIGYIKIFRQFVNRLLDDNNIKNIFWFNKDDKKDLFILFNLSSIVIYLILFKAVLYNGWRHIYFLNIFLIYISVVGLNDIGKYLKIKYLKNIHYYFSLIFLFSLLFKMITYHPFQSLYFNNFHNKMANENYEIDYWGLSGKKFLLDLISSNKDKDKIYIGTASFLPLGRSKDLIEAEDRAKLVFVGQNYNEAEYIYTNFIYDTGKFKNFKYEIPKNFSLVDEFRLDGFKVFEVYKKK